MLRVALASAFLAVCNGVPAPYSLTLDASRVPTAYSLTLDASLVDHHNEECWKPCNSADGACPGFCGERGACCREGFDHARPECGSGRLGCSGNHCCVLSEPSAPAPPEVDLTGATATQSTTAHGGLAGNALKPNPGDNYGGGTCTHTASESHPWWEVALPSSQKILAVKVLNRKDCCSDRLEGFSVSVDGQVCASDVKLRDRVRRMIAMMQLLTVSA